MTFSEDKIPDGELERFLEGRADPNIGRIIEASTELSELTQDLSDLTTYIQSTLFRENCPSTSELGDFHLRLLSDNEENTIRSHVRRCPHCTRELVLFQKELGNPLRPATFQEKLHIFFAQALNFSDAPNAQDDGITLAPAFMVRGEAEDQAKIFEAGGGWQIVVDVQEDSEHSGYKVVTGLIIGTIEGDINIQLWRDGNLLDVAQINMAGNFEFNQLQPGDYEIIIQGKEIIIHIQTFTIKSI